MEKTTIYLPGDLQRTMRQLARQTGRAQADLIREALTEYVSRMDRLRPRSLAAGDDGGLAARDSEAWLGAEWGDVARTPADTPPGPGHAPEPPVER